jgi:hypothetical protein
LALEGIITNGNTERFYEITKAPIRKPDSISWHLSTGVHVLVTNFAHEIKWVKYNYDEWLAARAGALKKIYGRIGGDICAVCCENSCFSAFAVRADYRNCSVSFF